MLAQYINGNTLVSIYEDGTKVREYEGAAYPDFPESIDVKITGWCNLGCSYCHESSTVDGLHGDLDILLEKMKGLPAGVELAIGGGNPLSHPDLMPFLIKLKELGFIANITVNQGHLKPYADMVKFLMASDLVKGVGISITSKNYKHIRQLLEISDNIVYHLIAGVNSIEEVDGLIKLNEQFNRECKILILGYKVFGMGIKYYEGGKETVQKNLTKWHSGVRGLIGKCLLSFDNLAISQLNVKQLFTEEGWDKFYMGDDFQFSMYIDAVKQEYAPTSRSKERASFDETDLIKFFKNKK